MLLNASLAEADVMVYDLWREVLALFNCLNIVNVINIVIIN